MSAQTEPIAKPPIRVKMKVGNLEFEIECQEDQLEESIRKILLTVKESGQPITITERFTPPTRAETCKVIIQRLWEEGWFSTARGLGEVHSEMARRGFHYDRTAVAHALIDMVKDGVLNREGRARRYQYIQKRPPSSRA